MLRSNLKRIIGTLTVSLIGRKLLFRISRYFLNVARLDTGNKMTSNGELWLQQHVVNLLTNNECHVFFDVGANRGEWTIRLLKQTDKSNRMVVHCFEPSNDTCHLLEEKAYSSHPFCERARQQAQWRKP